MINLKKKGEYFREPNESAEDRKVIVTAYSVNVRDFPGLNNEILGAVVSDTELEYRNTAADSDGVDWYGVDFNGKLGWICSKYSRLVE